MKTWFKLWKQKINSWRQCSWFERRLFIEAFVWLGAARLALWLFRFQRIADGLGQQLGPADVTVNMAMLNHAREICWAVRTAARYTPWESACLAQALTAQKMLWSNDISSTLYLGVAKDKNNPQKLKAHAWVRYGDAFLTGAAGHHQYTVVAEFTGSSKNR